MSNHRPPSRSGSWEDNRRRDYEYDEPRPRSSARSGTQSRTSESRSQAPRTSGRPSSDRPGTGRVPSGRPSSGRTPTGRPPSDRPGSDRAPAGRPPSGRPTRRPVKRRRRFPLLPLLFFLALLAVMALILRACLSPGESSSPGNYQLNFSSSPLIVGETGQATLNGLPEEFAGDILWSSSATNIVTVSGSGSTCTLSAKTKGEASIVAIVDGVTYSSTIQVIEPGQVISELTLNQTTAVILSGNTLQLTASVTKEDQSEGGNVAVTWVSSNLSVARVTNDGLVTARDVGTASITATLGNQTASCAITVQRNSDGQQVTSQEGYEMVPEPEAAGTTQQQASASPPGTASGNDIMVTSLAFHQTFGFLNVGETLTVGATVNPSNAAITWSSNDPAVATVSPQGVVTAKSPGKALISAAAGTFSVSYNLTVDAPDDSSTSAGIQGPSGDDQIYPED